LLGERPEEPTLVPLGVGPGCKKKQMDKVSAARPPPHLRPSPPTPHPHRSPGEKVRLKVGISAWERWGPWKGGRGHVPCWRLEDGRS
jgi:hypothetical protein